MAAPRAERASGAYIRLKAPIPMIRLTASRCKACLSAGAGSANDLHLQVLSELAHRFSNRQLRETLLTTTDPAEAHRLLAEWPAHAQHQCSSPVSGQCQKLDLVWVAGSSGTDNRIHADQQRPRWRWSATST